MSDPTFHQGFLPFPKLDAPLVDENGHITIPWYRTLIRIWQIATASGHTNFQNAVSLSSLGASSASGNPIVATSPATGVTVGDVVTPDTVLEILSAIQVPSDSPIPIDESEFVRIFELNPQDQIDLSEFVKIYEMVPQDRSADVLDSVLLSSMLDIGL